MCDNELRLNRRLAPSVYLDVVAICYAAANDAFVVEPANISAQMQVVDYAVKMVRLADDRTLLDAVRNKLLVLIEYGTMMIDSCCLYSAVRDHDLKPIVDLIATFHHKTAARSPSISRFGSYDSILYNIGENFTQTTHHVEAGLSVESVAAIIHRSDRIAGLVESNVYDEVKRRQLQAGGAVLSAVINYLSMIAAAR
jgi:aminoglycoside phosphotransferase family enzyme